MLGWPTYVTVRRDGTTAHYLGLRVCRHSVGSRGARRWKSRSGLCTFYRPARPTWRGGSADKISRRANPETDPVGAERTAGLHGDPFDPTGHEPATWPSGTRLAAGGVRCGRGVLHLLQLE